jgi:hypothetical protein
MQSSLLLTNDSSFRTRVVRADAGYDFDSESRRQSAQRMSLV